MGSSASSWPSSVAGPMYDLVLDHAALGEVEPAMVWLERSFAERETDLVDLAVDPRLDALRESARFAKLLARLDFPG